MSEALSVLRDEEVRPTLRRKVDALADARVKRFINWGQRRLARNHTFREMKQYSDVTIAEDTYRFAWPPRMKNLVSLTVQDGANSRKLTYVYHREFDRIVPRPEEITTGRPVWFVDYGVEYEILPIPDADYTGTLRFSQYPIDYDLDTDTSSFVERDQIIVAAACAHGFGTLQEYSDSAAWNAIYKALRDEAIAEEVPEPDWLPIARGFSTGYTPPGYASHENPFYRRGHRG